MSNDYRVLGRDHSFRMTQDGALLAETTALSNIGFKLATTLLSEGYLGEQAKRHREIFDEVALNFKVAPEGKEIFQMQKAVYDRARTGLGAVQFNFGFRIQFASGTIVRIVVPDLKFGVNGDTDVPSREQFSSMTFDAKAGLYVPSFV